LQNQSLGLGPPFALEASVKILLVEDQPKSGVLLANLLRGEGWNVDLCSMGQIATPVARSDLLDVIVVDCNLATSDGLAVCRNLCTSGAHAPILMLHPRSEPAARVEALRSGADDYLVRPFDRDELLARIAALGRRGPPSKLRMGGLEIHRIARKVTLGGSPVELTTREYALLVQLTLASGAPVSRGALLAGVWGVNFDPGTNVVEVHISRLRDKLGAFADMIQTVRGVGYKLRAERVA
jgi:DNA-binding response OmpR family regulator